MQKTAVSSPPNPQSGFAGVVCIGADIGQRIVTIRIADGRWTAVKIRSYPKMKADFGALSSRSRDRQAGNAEVGMQCRTENGVAKPFHGRSSGVKRWSCCELGFLEYYPYCPSC